MVLPYSKIVLKQSVIDIHDLFFRATAYAYIVKILLFLLKDDLSIKSADLVSSLYNGNFVSLALFVICGENIFLANSCFRYFIHYKYNNNIDLFW